ncbi:MAG: hypothetical protein CMD18_06610 [Flavobacteriales bacterium]|nr:hypothetical protein [Flavobacteriales bacterium]|tara:strand:+ start:48 stop:446 length:399 start_codon:yes stop_codon:yes gene_type:complete
MFRILILIICSSALFFACGKSEKSIVRAKNKVGKPCNVKVVISGKAPKVQFTLFTKAREKEVTIDREIDVLDTIKDEFSFSSYTGGKLSCELKTKDSYGPEVVVHIFINGKLWQSQSGNYNPKIEGILPTDF